MASLPQGAYLPGINEKFERIVDPVVLTDKKAIHVLAATEHKDQFGVSRKPGDKWLVTRNETDLFIPDIGQTIVAEVPLTQLDKKSYLTIHHPWKKGENLYGHKEIRRGEQNFFLQPGETLESATPSTVYVLTAEQALFVKCIQQFDDNSTGKIRQRVPGQKWLIKGPKEYCPSAEVRVLGTRRAFLTLGGIQFFRMDVFLARLSFYIVIIGIVLYYLIRFFF